MVYDDEESPKTFLMTMRRNGVLSCKCSRVSLVSTHHVFWSFSTFTHSFSDSIFKNQVSGLGSNWQFPLFFFQYPLYLFTKESKILFLFHNIPLVKITFNVFFIRAESFKVPIFKQVRHKTKPTLLPSKKIKCKQIKLRFLH